MVRTSLSASARRCGILAALLVGVVLGGAFAQDKELAPERIQKLIEASIHGSPVVRPQAAERLIGAADQVRGAVMERLLQAAAVPDQEGWFPLGPDFLRAAAELAPADGSPDGPRAKLWKAIGESSFPWRAPVVQGLGLSAAGEEPARFVAMLADPLPLVRQASLEGLGKLPSARVVELVKSTLATETDDRVQRGLALLALRHGDLPAAWRLFHELTRNDRFFDQPVGQVARLEAAQFLQQAMPEAPHVDGSLDPKSPEAEAQRAALAEYLRAQAGPDPGASQTSVEPEGSTVLGLELRSCRSGEAFLRWTDQDTLWVGRTSPVVVALAPGTTERLQAAADAMGAAMGKKYLTGEAGCDLEGFHWRPDGAKRSSRYLVTKGPKPVPGLRPAPLQAMAQALLLTLPSGPQLEPQLDHLRERIAGLLTDIGGALDAESGPAAR